MEREQLKIIACRHTAIRTSSNEDSIPQCSIQAESDSVPKPESVRDLGTRVQFPNQQVE